MKKLLLVIGLLLIAVRGNAAGGVSTATARRIVTFFSAPSGCVEGDKYYNLTSHTEFTCTSAGAWTATGGSSGSFITTDGTTTGATSVIQPFTNGIKTTATTGLVGIGMAPGAMLDVTAPAALNAIQAVGTQPAGVASGNGTTALAGLLITAPKGGDTSHTQANRFGGVGGPISLVCGDGGQETGASSGTARGGTGGQFSITSGTGGAATAVTGTVKGGSGGLVVISSGTGGTSATSTGGVGGTVSVTAGSGGVSTAATTSGNGGAVSIIAGTGGTNGTAGGTGGAGGNAAIDAGAAGTGSGGASIGLAGTITVGGTNARTIGIGNTNSVTTITGQLATSGTVPAVSNTTANSCGTTAATLTGNDATGVITVGATAGTSCTITFVIAAPTRRQCTVTNETTANLSRSTFLTTTTSTVEGTFAAGDQISYVCAVY